MPEYAAHINEIIIILSIGQYHDNADPVSIGLPIVSSFSYGMYCVRRRTLYGQVSGIRIRRATYKL